MKMNNLDKSYLALCQDILDRGTKKKTRTGTDSISVFGRTIRYKFKDGKFPLLTTKKMFFKGIVTELLWFLRGSTNIKFLVDNDCHIWDGDAWANYSKKIIANNLQLIPAIDLPETKEEFIHKIKTDDEFAKTWGELGPIYGKQWRAFDEDASGGIDQIANLINDLKTNPDSRRLLVTAWNPSYQQHMVLPPCHYGFQCYTRELSLNDRILEFAKRDLDPSEFMRGANYGIAIPEEKTLEVLNKHNIPTRAISLMWNQRSVDVPLGLPFNIASYGLLLHILATATNMIPDELIGNLGDCHIYENQIDGIKEQLTREPFELPRLNINTEFWPTQSGECGVGPLVDNVDWLIRGMEIDDFKIENYESYPAIKMPLSN